MGWEVARQFRKERTYLYLWLIHVDVGQKRIQYCKAIILQLKINTFFKKECIPGYHVIYDEKKKSY